MARRSQLRNHAEAALVKALLAWLRASRDPVRAARAALTLLDLAVPRLRAAAWRNFEIAMPELPRGERARLLEGCWTNLARVLAMVAQFPRIHAGNVGRFIRYEGLENYQRARARGRGVLVATAHLGNWEFSAFAHALMTEPMAVVVRPLDNPLLDALATRYRTLSGNRILGRGQHFLRPLLETLHAGGAVGILVDQNVTADRGVFVDFFGRKACVDSGLARLAYRTGAAVLLGYALWSDAEQRYVLHFEPEIPISGDALADTQAVHARLEAAIRRAPDQWLWIHRRWKTRPPGEPPLY
ncbi:MAG: lysophospholipid acyltransferase family protein [Bryobacteraceae bacterium]|nr:lysophospholipid acyltransferase family protein [Bryobacteraceae bacterium]